MQEPLRIVCVEQLCEDPGNVARILTDSHLAFGWKRAASTGELIRIAADFNPHIVLCTDDLTNATSQALLGALRLLCSQTPVILVSSMCDGDGDSWAAGRRLRPIEEDRPSDAKLEQSIVPGALRNDSDARFLRAAFSVILESSMTPAVMTDGAGWVTDANTSACRLLSSRCERSLMTLMGEVNDQCTAMPHWLPQLDDANQGVARHRLAYIDEWSLLPTRVHVDELIGRGTTSQCECREALALIAVEPDGERIPDDAFDRDCEAGRDDRGLMGGQATTLRHGSILRISQDDFLVVLPGSSGAADAASTVHRLLDSIARNRRSVAPAIGPFASSASPLPPPRHHRAVPVARTAMTRMGAQLQDAVERQALHVVYQPQFDLKTGRGCGIEALARWTRSSGDIVAPSIFIPIAEKEGMIQALGAWILKSACATAYDWCGRDAQRTTLSVNVSALQIDETFRSVIEKVLETSRFPAKCLELEITESALIADPDRVIECLKKWRSLGIRIAMDDFGTGYSSLSYLARLPVDTLKVDQSLIHRMTVDKRSAAVTRAIVSLAMELGIDVIAEGVETEEQLDMLMDLEVPRAQGYLLARPMPAKQAQVVLRKSWGDRLGSAAQRMPAAAGASCVN